MFQSFTANHVSSLSAHCCTICDFPLHNEPLLNNPGVFIDPRLITPPFIQDIFIIFEVLAAQKVTTIKYKPFPLLHKACEWFK